MGEHHRTPLYIAQLSKENRLLAGLLAVMILRHKQDHPGEPILLSPQEAAVADPRGRLKVDGLAQGFIRIDLLDKAPEKPLIEVVQ